MSHELEMNGTQASMFFVGETPWHGLGTKVEEGLKSSDAIVRAGLDWTVKTAKLQAVVKLDDGATTALDIPKHVAVVRSSDQKVLGVVGNTYRPLQNKEAFAWFDPWIEAGEAVYETAGSLRGGRRVWILAKIKKDPIVIVAKADDTVERFVLLSNGHDGSLAIRCGFSAIRVVCANTLASAHGDGASKLLRVRHTAKSADTMTKIRDVMNLAENEFQATADQYRSLATYMIKKDDLKSYIKMVFRPDLEATDESDEGAEEKAKRLINDITPLFEKGRGNDAPGVAGTMWAAYNAITEYLNYERGREASTRLDSLWYGEGARINEKALATAVKIRMRA